MKRSTLSYTPADVVCHWCKQPGQGSSPYRTFDPAYPAGTRLIVCGPDCPEAQGDVFTVWTSR